MVTFLPSTSTSVFRSDFVISGLVEFEIRCMISQGTPIIIVCDVNKETLPVNAFCLIL